MSIDVEMADGNQSVHSLKPVGGIGKKSQRKFKMGKGKRLGKGIRRKHHVWFHHRYCCKGSLKEIDHFRTMLQVLMKASPTGLQENPEDPASPLVQPRSSVGSRLGDI